MKQANEEKNEVLSLSLERFCFNKEWILRSCPQEYIEHCICLICKQIANNPMEIECPKHVDMNKTLIIGEHCLKLFLENHNNSCPIQSHDNCHNVRRQFEQELRRSNETEREGEIPGVIKCDFKGKLRDLNSHLINECPLNLIDCWFKSFGCNHNCSKHNLKEHLITDMKFHFDLVSQLFQSMKQEIQLKDKQIIEKEKQIKKMEREYQQELLKCRADIEMMKKDNDKELDVLSDHEKTVKSLEEKNIKSTQDYKQLLQEEKKEEHKKEIYQSSTSLSSSTISLDLFRSSSRLIKTFIGHIGWVWSIDYSTFDDGTQLLCSGSQDKTVRLWDMKTTKQIQSFNGHLDIVYCVKFSSYHYHNYHRNVICSSSADKTIQFWDLKDNQKLQVFNEHTEWVGGIEFSSFNGGRYLCSGSNDKTVRLWDIETSKSLHVFNGHTNCVYCVDISPLQISKSNDINLIGGNGYTICSGSYDKTIRIWDIETTKQLTVFKKHEDWIMSVKYGSNELINTILSGSDDKSIRLWDIRSGEQIQMFNGHTNTVWNVAYSPFVAKNIEFDCNSNVICSGSMDNTIRFWDIRSNKDELFMIRGDENSNNGVVCLKFVPSKKKRKNDRQKLNDINLCYGSFKGPIRIWG
ncbi:WD-40 repeat-containing protein [Reticulomyxa filosa]|uniref:WD-40 repeat-containing protein n=1 Tax=Reticulomyxa filosa TaxID=46433 RepID=X6MJW3_RETFI|nr:WD-40 repeat-containing protein [Reticulomyxa filosa]|eukprot:ETO14159.1 WD-40 repeat-containing protein [Reticulomyxa filosa]